jgi:hypothetical protein
MTYSSSSLLVGVVSRPHLLLLVCDDATDKTVTIKNKSNPHPSVFAFSIRLHIKFPKFSYRLL